MTQRRITITTQPLNTLIIEFQELTGHKFESKYHIIVDESELATISLNNMMIGWIEGSDIVYPGLMID